MERTENNLGENTLEPSHMRGIGSIGKRRRAGYVEQGEKLRHATSDNRRVPLPISHSEGSGRKGWEKERDRNEI